MALRDILLNSFKNLLIEGPAKKKTLDELAAELERNGAALSTRFGGIANSANNRKQLRHITGIERWGISRLRVLAGQSYKPDEYDGYQPAESIDWNDLREAFTTTRSETVSLARQLARNGIQPNATVPHNMFGPLSLRGWLSYLNNHAERESKLIR